MLALLALGLLLPGQAWGQEELAADDGAYDDGGGDWERHGGVVEEEDSPEEDATGEIGAEPDMAEEDFGPTLDPLGHWEIHPQHGRVWVPRGSLVGPGWRPYSRGHWVYSDLGWSWISDFSWGWAPFHYGRWFAWGGRWVWRPGRVWAPAWVAWRTHGDVVGWAPLGPGMHVSTGLAGPSYDAWVFVPVGHLGARHVWRHYVPRHRVRHYYGASRPAYGVRRRGRRIWYHGPRRQWVSSRWHRPVPRVRYAPRYRSRSRAIRSQRQRQTGRQRRGAVRRSDRRRSNAKRRQRPTRGSRRRSRSGDGARGGGAPRRR